MPKLKPNSDIDLLYGRHYAHRGLHDNNNHVPENSLMAFKLAVDKGYGIELDVQLTKDKVAVIMHDYRLKRACGLDAMVYDMDYEELLSYRLFNTDEKIPTLKEALSCIDGKVPVFIELKVPNKARESCQIVSNELEAYRGFYAIKSFNPFVLLWYKKHKPNVVRGQLSSDFIKKRPKEFQGSILRYFLLKHMFFNVFTKPDFISYNHMFKKSLSFTICRSLYKLPTVAWTIRSEKEMKDCQPYYDIFVFEAFKPMNKLAIKGKELSKGKR